MNPLVTSSKILNKNNVRTFSLDLSKLVNNERTSDNNKNEDIKSVSEIKKSNSKCEKSHIKSNKDTNKITDLQTKVNTFQDLIFYNQNASEKISNPNTNLQSEPLSGTKTQSKNYITQFSHNYVDNSHNSHNSLNSLISNNSNKAMNSFNCLNSIKKNFISRINDKNFRINSKPKLESALSKTSNTKKIENFDKKTPKNNLTDINKNLATDAFNHPTISSSCNESKKVSYVSNGLSKYLQSVNLNTSFNYININNLQGGKILNEKPNDSRNVSKNNLMSNSFLYSTNKNPAVGKIPTNPTNITNASNLNFKNISINKTNNSNIRRIYSSFSKSKNSENEKNFVKRNFGKSFEANSNLTNLVDLYNKKNYIINSKPTYGLDKSINLSKSKSNSKSKLHIVKAKDNFNPSKENMEEFYSFPHDTKSNTPTQAIIQNSIEGGFQLRNTCSDKKNYASHTSSIQIGLLDNDTKFKLQNLKENIYEILNFDSNKTNFNKLQIFKELEMIYREVMTSYNSLFNENTTHIEYYLYNNTNTNTNTNELTDERMKTYSTIEELKEKIKTSEINYHKLSLEYENLKNKNEMLERKIILSDEENSKLRNFLKEKTENMEDLKAIMTHYKKEFEKMKKNYKREEKISCEESEEYFDCECDESNTETKKGSSYGNKIAGDPNAELEIKNNQALSDNQNNFKLIKSSANKKNTPLFQKINHINQRNQEKNPYENTNSNSNTNSQTNNKNGDSLPFSDLKDKSNIYDEDIIIDGVESHDVNNDNIDGESKEISIEDQEILHYNFNHKSSKSRKKLNDTAINIVPENVRMDYLAYMNNQNDEAKKNLIQLEKIKSNSNSQENLNENDELSQIPRHSQKRLITVHKLNANSSNNDGSEERVFFSSRVESLDDELLAKVNRMKTGCFAGEPDKRNNLESKISFLILDTIVDDSKEDDNEFSEINLQKDNRLSLNLEKLKPKNFQDEFLENYEEFSLSWRKEVEKMNKSNRK